MRLPQMRMVSIQTSALRSGYSSNRLLIQGEENVKFAQIILVCITALAYQEQPQLQCICIREWIPPLHGSPPGGGSPVGGWLSHAAQSSNVSSRIELI